MARGTGPSLGLSPAAWKTCPTLYEDNGWEWPGRGGDRSRGTGGMALGSIRVMIVDDSPLMREMLRDAVDAQGGMEVVGLCASGQEALETIDRVCPDVVTLDIQMPGLDGLDTLDRLLAKRDVPILMVSSLTQLGASITLEALDRGALDYIGKPEGIAAARQLFGDQLPRNIRLAAGADIRRVIGVRRNRAAARAERGAHHQARRSEAKPGPRPSRDGRLADKLIALGISTGGPPALTRLFESLGPPLPPIAIVQHMPAAFTGPLARRLDAISELDIREARDRDPLSENTVYVAPGGKHLTIKGRTLRVVDGEPVSGHRPSVDVLMSTAAKSYGGNVLGVVMTGMGRDGSDGCGAIRAAGGYVLGQDQATSDVYGMNRVAFLEGNVDQQFSLEDGARRIRKFVDARWLKSDGAPQQFAAAGR